MTAEQINPAMIVLARESRAWSQVELAEHIKVSTANLSKLERGEVNLSETILSNISEVTDYPLQFFKQPGTILPTNLSYRKRQVVQQKLITPIEAKINIIKKHVELLSGLLNKEAPQLPLYDVTEKHTPQKIAQLVRRAWGIDVGVMRDLCKIVEANGIIVKAFDFGTERVDSRSMITLDKQPIIFLNSSQQGDRQRFSLAHELGHLIMHTFTIVAADRDISHEANLFAAELLMPAKEIIKDYAGGVTIPLLGELKRKWKVSMISLLYRADDLELLTPNQKRYLVQQFNQLKIRRTEPVELSIDPEKPKLLRNWIAELQQKSKLSVVDIAAILCLSTTEYMEIYY